jgi:hypothetical protein
LDARDWYKALAVNSIDGWNTFHDRFMDKWSHKQDNVFLLKSVSFIKKDENESMEEFNSRFMKAYYKIPHTVRPNLASALIFYIEQFDGLFGVFLKQKEPRDLESTFKEALKIEKHFVTANQAKVSLQELLDPQGRKVSQTPSPSLAQPLLELKKEPKKEEDDLSSNPQVVSLLQNLVQKLNIQDKASHPSASSQRTFNQQRRNFQAHRNFENPKNPNPALGANFVGKNSLFSRLTIELVTCLILRILASCLPNMCMSS